MRIFLSLPLFVVLAAAGARGQEPPPSGVTSHLPPSGVTVFGAVLDLDERPLAGAHVLVAADRSEAAPDEPRVTVTDPAGRFELEQVVPGSHLLRARSPGYREFTVVGIAVEGDGAEPVDLGILLLAPDRPVRGRVTDPDGQPVPQARVAFELRRPRRDPEPSETRETFTLADGTFALEGLPAGARVDLEISHELFRSRDLAGVPSDREEPLPVVLEPGLTLAGEVVDEAGEPVPDVAVELVRSSPRRGLTTVRTDARGRFLFPGQAPGEVTVRVSSPDGFAELLELELDGAPSEVRLELRRGTVLDGWVLDPDEVAVVGAEIRLEREQPGVVDEASLRPGGLATGRTDDSGRFRLSGLGEGRFRISAHHPDFQAAVELIELADTSLAEVELRFEERRSKVGLRVAGRVFDSSDAPVASAMVRLVSPHRVSSLRRPAASDVSGGEGRFELDAPQAGEYVVEVEHPGFAVYRGAAFRLGGAPREALEVRLVASGTVAGSIAGLEPEHLAGLVVTAASERGAVVEGGVRHDGSYRIAGLAPGEWTIRAEMDGRRTSGRIRLPRPGAEARLDLRFAAGFRLTGSVTRLGEPLTGRRVDALCHHDTFRGSAPTDAFGRFELRDVPEGRCTLSLSGARGVPEGRREVEVAGETEVAIELEALSLAGRVVSADGRRPVAGASLVLADVASSLAVARGVTDAGGRFELRDVDRGPWKLRVAKEGFALLEWELAADGRDDLLFHLHPVRETALYVFDPEGGVPAYVRLELGNGAGSTLLRQTHQPELDGRVTLDGLPAGVWQLRVSGEGYTSRAELRVPGDPVWIVLGGGGPGDPQAPAAASPPSQLR